MLIYILIFLLLPLEIIGANISEGQLRELSGPFGDGSFTFVLCYLEPMCECQLNDTNFTNYKGASVNLLR